MDVFGHTVSERWVQRFWDGVDKSAGDSGCWPWIRCRNPGGYGVLNTQDDTGKNVGFLAHRVAYVLNGGVFPENKPLVLHSCHNPSCINPAHLRAGDDKDNSEDKVKAGRAAAGDRHKSRTRPETVSRGVAHRMAKMSDESVQKIRDMYASGGWSYPKLGAEFGIDRATAFRIVKRKNWKHVA